VDIKFNCAGCGTHIVIDEAGAGMSVQCPKCGQSLTVPMASAIDSPSVPAPSSPVTPAGLSESNPTEKLAAYLAASAFPKNRAELRLLSKFIGHIEMGNPPQLQYWQTIIENPMGVIERFLSEGFIQEANPDVSEFLQSTKTSVELKALARERGVAATGTKQVLAERLVKADPAGMSEFFHGRKFLTCSPKGRILADKFRESEKYAESHAEKLCFEALSQLRFEDARLLAKNYFSTGGLPAPAKIKSSDEENRKHQWFTAKGALPVGTDIEEYEAEQAKAGCLNYLNLIFTTKLLRHARFNQETMRAIQIAAAMSSFWGTGKPPRWMMENYRDADFDLEFESRMLKFTASHIVTIQGYKEAGYRTAQIVGQDDPEVCEVCRADNEKIYPVDSCPILPHENCTCDGGCSCFVGVGGSASDEADRLNLEEDLSGIKLDIKPEDIIQ
jgi:hypothetical protein